MAVNFEIPTETIKVGNGSFTVRGMNSEDVTFLTVNYLDEMKATVARFADKKGRFRQSAVAELAMEVAKMAPLMVVEIISRCAEAESEADVLKFRALAFPKQVEALKAIAMLTVEDGGIDLKKFAGIAASLLEQNGLQPGPMMTILQTIIETSETPSPT